MYFAISRAEQCSYTKLIRLPEWKTCPLCNQKFVEDSLPDPLIKRLGIDRLEFCAPCLRDIVIQNYGDDYATKPSILKYLKDLSDLIGRVPTQDFGTGMTDLLDLENSERIKLLKLLRDRPALKRVKSFYGSWLNALIQAGILEDGTRKTSRGIQTISKDGHVCLSLGEKTIDDWLFAHGIPHEKEPKYPEGKYRADFKVKNVLIEYFGLVGNAEYDAKTKVKTNILKTHAVVLIAIYPKDLIRNDLLEKKLSPLLIPREQ